MLGGVCEPFLKQYLTIAVKIGETLFYSILEQRVSQIAMLQLFGFERDLVALRSSQYIHTFLVCQLRQSPCIHGPASLLFCFQSLAGLTSVNQQQYLIGLQIFQRTFQVPIRDAMSQDHFESLQVRSRSPVTEIMWNQIEAIMVSSAMPGEVNYNSVFRLCLVDFCQRARRRRRQRTKVRACQSFQSQQDIGSGRLRVK